MIEDDETGYQILPENLELRRELSSYFAGEYDDPLHQQCVYFATDDELIGLYGGLEDAAGPPRAAELRLVWRPETE